MSNALPRMNSGRIAPLRRGRTLIFVVTLLQPAPALAQVTTGADLSTRSDYVWRGITLSNRMVAQPAAFVGYDFTPGILSAGAWASLEPFEPGEDDLTDAGRDGRVLAEVDYWIQYAQRLGSPYAVDVALGFSGYTFHGDSASGGRGSEWNTQEFYGSVGVAGMLGPVSLSWSGWKDVGQIGGFYMELGTVLTLPVFPVGEPLGSLFLGGVAGFSWGQQVSSTTASDYYQGEGLTHLDFSLAATPTFHIGSVPLVLFTAVHLQVGNDGITKRRGQDPMTTSDVFPWFELTVSAWYTFGRAFRP